MYELHANFEYILCHGDCSYVKTIQGTKIDLNQIYRLVPSLVYSCVVVVEKMRAKVSKTYYYAKMYLKCEF